MKSTFVLIVAAAHATKIAQSDDDTFTFSITVGDDNPIHKTESSRDPEYLHFKVTGET